MASRLLLIVLALPLLMGCRASSKWAMDDSGYAKKYGRPYSERGWRKHRRMAKQMADARFIEDESGWYFGGEAQSDPGHLGGEVGIIHFPKSWVSVRGSLAGNMTEGSAPGYFAGLDSGIRFFPPARLAPFVGFGGFAGYYKEELKLTLGSSENTDQGPLPIPTEEELEDAQTHGGLAAIYPELGWGFWLTGSTQVLLRSRYYFSTDGRNQDHWTIGVGLTILLRDEPSTGTAVSTTKGIEIDDVDELNRRIDASHRQPRMESFSPLEPNVIPLVEPQPENPAPSSDNQESPSAEPTTPVNPTSPLLTPL